MGMKERKSETYLLRGRKVHEQKTCAFRKNSHQWCLSRLICLKLCL